MILLTGSEGSHSDMCSSIAFLRSHTQLQFTDRQRDLVVVTDVPGSRRITASLSKVREGDHPGSYSDGRE